jgi:hypothetical protein
MTTPPDNVKAERVEVPETYQRRLARLRAVYNPGCGLINVSPTGEPDDDGDQESELQHFTRLTQEAKDLGLVDLYALLEATRWASVEASAAHVNYYAIYEALVEGSDDDRDALGHYAFRVAMDDDENAAAWKQAVLAISETFDDCEMTWDEEDVQVAAKAILNPAIRAMFVREGEAHRGFGVAFDALEEFIQDVEPKRVCPHCFAVAEEDSFESIP